MSSLSCWREAQNIEDALDARDEFEQEDCHAMTRLAEVEKERDTARETIAAGERERAAVVAKLGGQISGLLTRLAEVEKERDALQVQRDANFDVIEKQEAHIAGLENERDEMLLGWEDQSKHFAEVEKKRDATIRAKEEDLQYWLRLEQEKRTKVEKERDIWQEHHHCAVRERDEALRVKENAIEGCVLWRKDWRVERNRAEAAEKERDEARADLAEYKQAHDFWEDRARAAEEERDEALAVLVRARSFIRNGIELGFIRMPDRDCPDPAHEMLPMIDAALSPDRQTEDTAKRHYCDCGKYDGMLNYPNLCKDGCYSNEA